MNPLYSTQRVAIRLQRTDTISNLRCLITQASLSLSGAVGYEQPGEVFDFIYGLHPNSPTGGCVVQRSFEKDLRGVAGVRSVNVHVASDPSSAEGVFELLQRQKQGEKERCEKGDEKPSGVLIIDGIALLFLRDRLQELRRSRRVMVGFIHSPFRWDFVCRFSSRGATSVSTGLNQGLENPGMRIIRRSKTSSLFCPTRPSGTCSAFLVPPPPTKAAKSNNSKSFDTFYSKIRWRAVPFCVAGKLNTPLEQHPSFTRKCILVPLSTSPDCFPLPRPDSEPFYRQEPWLRAAVPEHMLVDEHGAALHAEESRLFGLFDKIIATGAPCRSLLTADYGVAEDAVVLLEPTFATLPTTPFAAAGAGVNGPAGGGGPVEFPPRFVSVGTLCPRKGQLALIDALRAACASHPKELGGSVLTLIGDDGGDHSDAEAVRSAATASVTGGGSSDEKEGESRRDGRLEVRLLGPLPHGETLEHVSGSDAFLLNSSLESWAIAPVEAALRGVPVLSTRVGSLARSLPLESTIWVGSTRAEQERSADGVSSGLASSSDWEKALVQFACDRRRFKSRAERAVPELARRFSSAAAGSRAQAVEAILSTATGRYTPACDRSDRLAGDPDLSKGCADISEGAAIVEQERVRKATVTNALACVCATCVSVSGIGGAAGGLAALVAAQCFLLFSLAPPCSPANLVTVFRSFLPPAVVWCLARSDFGRVRREKCRKPLDYGGCSLFAHHSIALPITARPHWSS